MKIISEIELVNRFLKELLSTSEDSTKKLKETLHAQVEFKVLGKRAKGKDEVCEALKNGPNSQLMHQLIWHDAFQIKHQWQVEGHRK